MLIDWDPAPDTPAPQTKTHLSAVPTGTLRFMAIDLLDKKGVRGGVRRLYRHDLEALLCIFLWVVCCYEDGREVDPLPRTYEWTSDDMLVCRMSKHDLLMRGFEKDAGPTATWTPEAELVRSIHRYLRAQPSRDNNWGMAESSREEEADEPEKVWGEFCAVVRAVGTAHPAMSYILALIPGQTLDIRV